MSCRHYLSTLMDQSPTNQMYGSPLSVYGVLCLTALLLSLSISVYLCLHMHISFRRMFHPTVRQPMWVWIYCVPSVDCTVCSRLCLNCTIIIYFSWSPPPTKKRINLLPSISTPSCFNLERIYEIIFLFLTG